jgi:hypothetical protein
MVGNVQSSPVFHVDGPHMYVKAGRMPDYQHRPTDLRHEWNALFHKCMEAKLALGGALPM